MQIEACRVCSSPDMTVVLDLGMMAPCGIFPRTVEDDPVPAPLVVVRCGDCGLVQLQHDAPPEDTFNGDFGYRSSTNESMRRHLEDVAKSLYGAVELRPGDAVIDIGSNDGFFLRCLPDTLTRIGVDPTVEKFVDNYMAGKLSGFGAFWSADVADSVMAIIGGQAKAITCLACLYDLPDPNAFVAAVKKALHPEGVFLCEVAYLPRKMANGAFDDIVHEHLMYFHAEPLRRLMKNNGLQIEHVTITETYGGSILFVARHATDPAAPEWWGASEEVSTYTARQWPGFVARIEEAKLATMMFFARAHDEKARVHGLAASTKGNTLIQHFGITARELPFIADANPDKVGRYTPGSLIPIISEEKSRAMRPDYYFVFAAHFRSSIIARERAFLERGGKLVFPLPTFEVVGKEVLG